MQHRDDADREVAGDAAADLEEAQRGILGDFRVMIGEIHHVLDAALHRVHVLDVAVDHVRGEDVARRRIFPARHDDRQVLLRGSQHPRVLRIDLIEFLELSAEENPVHELVREVALPGLVGGRPLVENRLLDATDRFRFRNACIRDAVEVLFQQLLLVLRREIAIVRHALVVIVRHQIVNVLFEIRAGTSDRVHLVLPDHLGQRQPQLRRAHRAGERDHHLVPGFEMAHIAIGCVDERGCVEVAVVMTKKRRDGRGRGLGHEMNDSVRNGTATTAREDARTRVRGQRSIADQGRATPGGI